MFLPMLVLKPIKSIQQEVNIIEYHHLWVRKSNDKTNLHDVFAQWRAASGASTAEPTPLELDSKTEDQARHITLSQARSRLNQRRFWRPNTHFSASGFFRDLQNVSYRKHLLHRISAASLQNL